MNAVSAEDVRITHESVRHFWFVGAIERRGRRSGLPVVR
jgi:hypothetical protein